MRGLSSIVVYEPGMEDYKLNDATFIEGLPGIGLVAKVAVAYLLAKVKAKRLCRIYSPHYPSLLYVNEGKIVPNFTDIYCVEEPANVLVMYGNAQPSSSYGQYEYCTKVVELAAKHGAKRVFTLGGLGGKEKISPRREVYCSSTNKEYVEKYASLIDGHVYNGQIVGAVGLIMNVAGKLGLENMGMLVEISESVPDYYAARRGAEVFSKLSGLGVEVGDADEVSRVATRSMVNLESS